MALYDETDIKTLVKARELSDSMIKQLEVTMPRPVPVMIRDQDAIPTLDPEDLLPPPPSLPPSNIFESSWSTTMPIAAAPALLKKTTPSVRRRKKRKARSHLHWAVLAMCIAIACGLWRDEVARANAKRGFFAERDRVVKVVKSRMPKGLGVMSARII